MHGQQKERDLMSDAYDFQIKRMEIAWEIAQRFLELDRSGSPEQAEAAIARILKESWNVVEASFPKPTADW